MITPWLIGCDEVEGGLFWEILIEILPIWVNLIDPEPEARREHYRMQMGRFVCVFSSRVVALSTEVRNINVLWPFSRSPVSITSYSVWPQPQGHLLAHLPDVQPVAWCQGAVSPASANFSFPSPQCFHLEIGNPISALRWRLWQSSVTFVIAAGRHAQERPGCRSLASALRILLPTLLWKCSPLRALLRVCRIGSAFFLFL